MTLNITINDTDETYNGWSNYETWNLYTIISNDEKHFKTIQIFKPMFGLKGYCERHGLPTNNVNFGEILKAFIELFELENKE